MADSKPAAPMPQPTDEHAKLYILAGRQEVAVIVIF
jgi:hypothetical protein